MLGIRREYYLPACRAKVEKKARRSKCTWCKNESKLLVCCLQVSNIMCCGDILCFMVVLLSNFIPNSLLFISIFEYCVIV